MITKTKLDAIEIAMEIFMATSIVSNVVLLTIESFVRNCFIVTFFDNSDKQSKRFKTEEAI